jgi:hypothetical protein
MLEKQFEQFYQGDILYLKISEQELPVNIKWEKINHDFVVAEGEVSGHKHLITLTENSSAWIFREENEIFLKLEGTALLTHPQHNPEIQTAPKIETGFFYIGRQWEYDPRQERMVRD